MITFVTYFITIISLINLSLLFVALYSTIFIIDTNIYRYKIKYFILEGIIVGLYICLFFILYCWRIYNVNNPLNIKKVFDNCHKFWLINFSHIDFITQFIMFLSFLVIICYFLSLLFFLYSRCSLILFKFHLYYNYSTQLNKLLDLLHKPGISNIISFIILEMAYKITCVFDKDRLENNTLPKYHYYIVLYNILNKNYYKIETIITISPIFVFFYDMFCNYYILSHFNYYLIIYIPIIIIRRITYSSSTEANFLMCTLWNIYYKQENNVLYAISIAKKPLLDHLMLFGLRNIDHNLIDIDIDFNLSTILFFQLQYPERNVYMNNEPVYLQLTSDNKVFEEIEENETLFDLTTNEEHANFMARTTRSI